MKNVIRALKESIKHQRTHIKELKKAVLLQEQRIKKYENLLILIGKK